MTRDDAGKLFRLMRALFPALRNAHTEDMEDAYWLVLRNRDYSDVRNVVVELAGKQRMYPSTSEIVESLPKQEPTQREPLDHWTRDGMRRLLECTDDKCASCADVTTCRFRG